MRTFSKFSCCRMWSPSPTLLYNKRPYTERTPTPCVFPGSPCASTASAAAASVLLHEEGTLSLPSSRDATPPRGPADTRRSLGEAGAVRSPVGHGIIPLDTPGEVQEAFRSSVAARTVSNAQLRRYLERLEARDWALGMAAVRGAQVGGLSLTPPTYEVLLQLLMSSGQLKSGMDLYLGMIQQRMTPTAKSYAALMTLCLQRDIPEAALRLFKEMQQRGMKPQLENYELAMLALARQDPPQWKLAIEIFDKLSTGRNSAVNARTYNALMQVYMHMRPFDWRVVYNCYHEMRTRRNPLIHLEWSSYAILREALILGRAGRLRRLLAYADAWLCTTALWSRDFFAGVACFFAVTMVVKLLISYVALFLLGFMTTPHTAAQSTLPL